VRGIPRRTKFPRGENQTAHKLKKGGLQKKLGGKLIDGGGKKENKGVNKRNFFTSLNGGGKGPDWLKKRVKRQKGKKG